MSESVESTGSTRVGAERSATGLKHRLRRYRELRLTEEELASVLLTPVLLFLLTISFFPIADTFVASLHTGYVLEMNPQEFVGLEHYQWLFNSEAFWNALSVTLIYTFVSVPIELVFGLGLALLLDRDFKGKYFAQAAIVFPWALPTIINAKIWAWLYHGEFGVINDMLIRVGLLEEAFPFLSVPDVALPAMILVTIWKTSSFMALILLAGLQSIPDHLYEAAEMDGASRLLQFKDITLPLLKPTILVALIFRTLPAFQAFGLPFGLTGGGPAEATTTLVLFSHKLTFTNLSFGRGAAAATIITLLALVISLIYVGTLYEPEVS